MSSYVMKKIEKPDKPGDKPRTGIVKKEPCVLLMLAFRLLRVLECND
jgi:hypothetical protein